MTGDKGKRDAVRGACVVPERCDMLKEHEWCDVAASEVTGGSIAPGADAKGCLTLVVKVAIDRGQESGQPHEDSGESLEFCKQQSGKVRSLVQT